MVRILDLEININNERVNYARSKWSPQEQPHRWIKSRRNTEVATTFSTISRLWDRYRQHRSTRDLLRSGRPRVTTAACEIASPKQPLLLYPFLVKQLLILIGIRHIELKWLWTFKCSMNCKTICSVQKGIC